MKSLLNQKRSHNLCLLLLCCLAMLLGACRSASIDITVSDGSSNGQDEVSMDGSSESADTVAQASTPTTKPTTKPTNTPTTRPTPIPTNTSVPTADDQAENRADASVNVSRESSSDSGSDNVADNVADSSSASVDVTVDRESDAPVEPTAEPTPEPTPVATRDSLRTRESSINIKTGRNSTDARESESSRAVDVNIAVEAATEGTDAATSAAVPQPNIPEPNIPSPTLPGNSSTETVDETSTISVTVEMSRSESVNTGEVTTDNANEDDSADTEGDESGIAFGQTIEGAIDLENISAQYEINAVTNDQLSIRMMTAEGEFNPSFILFAPDGSEVCADKSSRVLAEAQCLITLSGVHKLLVQDGDYGSFDAGSYELHVQRTSNPANTTMLTVGDYATGQITDTHMVTSYQVEAGAQDMLFVQLGILSDELNPRIELYAPDGSLLCEEEEARPRATLLCPTTVAGLHTLMVMDAPYGERNVGDYALLIERVNVSTDEQVLEARLLLPVGETVTGQLETGLLAHFYRLEVEAGHTLYMQMSTTVGELQPSIEIYNQAGELICEESDAGMTVEMSCNNMVGGAYTVIIRDEVYGTLDGGEYSLYMQDLTSPANAGRLDGGKLYTDSLEPTQIAKAYTLTGRKSDVLALRMTQKDSEIDPNVTIADPNGAILCAEQTPSNALDVVCSLDQDGEYLVIVSDADYGEFNDGGFGLFLQNLGDVKNAKPIAVGESTIGVISDITEQQTYVLDGKAGAVFAITLFVISGDDLDPELRLFDSTGEVICDLKSYGNSDTEQCTLNNDGEHLIMVGSGTSNQLLDGEFGLVITQVSAE